MPTYGNVWRLQPLMVNSEPMLKIVGQTIPKFSFPAGHEKTLCYPVTEHANQFQRGGPILMRFFLMH